VKGRGRRDAVTSHMYLNNNFRILHLELCVILCFHHVIFCMIIYRCSFCYHSILLLSCLQFMDQVSDISTCQADTD